MKTIPKGIKIGHAQNEFTGVTAILCEDGCVAGVDVRGGAPGTHETDLLSNEKAMQKIHGVALCGGSAYGLGAVAGIMQYLKEKNVGFEIQDKVVPIVSGAVIYDLNDAEYRYPDFNMGYEAAVNAAEDNIQTGNIGAGTGARVGKVRGVKHSQKSGLGISSVKIGGITVTAVAVVNALGDIYDGENIIAGALDNKGKFLDTEKTILEGDYLRLIMGTNTTIACILTDAKLNKIQANKIASIAHNGLARAIRPVHTDYDGDTVFCMATGKKRVLNFMLLQVGAVKAMERAIVDAAGLPQQ